MSLCRWHGEVLEGINTIKDADNYKYSADNEYIKKLDVTDVSLSEGRVSVKMSVDANIYYGNFKRAYRN